MRKAIFTGSLIALIFVLCMVTKGVRSELLRHANEGSSIHGQHAGVVPLGNTKCVVSGDHVEEEFYVDYQGKRIGLCCPSCKEWFLKNPEKYL